MTLKRAYLILLLAVVWLIGISILAALVDQYVVHDERVIGVLIGTALIGCSIWLLVGFGVWAGAKGYSPLLGAVLAWIGPLGMLILVFLPDKSIKPSAAIYGSKDDSSLA
jgi:hypothetical protein